MPGTGDQDGLPEERPLRRTRRVPAPVRLRSPRPSRPEGEYVRCESLLRPLPACSGPRFDREGCSGGRLPQVFPETFRHRSKPDSTRERFGSPCRTRVCPETLPEPGSPAGGLSCRVAPGRSQEPGRRNGRHESSGFQHSRLPPRPRLRRGRSRRGFRADRNASVSSADRPNTSGSPP